MSKSGVICFLAQAVNAQTRQPISANITSGSSTSRDLAAKWFQFPIQLSGRDNGSGRSLLVDCESETEVNESDFCATSINGIFGSLCSSINITDGSANTVPLNLLNEAIRATGNMGISGNLHVCGERLSVGSINGPGCGGEIFANNGYFNQASGADFYAEYVQVGDNNPDFVSLDDNEVLVSNKTTVTENTYSINLNLLGAGPLKATNVWTWGLWSIMRAVNFDCDK